MDQRFTPIVVSFEGGGYIPKPSLPTMKLLIEAINSFVKDTIFCTEAVIIC
jgi:hypothetical protein